MLDYALFDYACFADNDTLYTEKLFFPKYFGDTAKMVRPEIQNLQM